MSDWIKCCGFGNNGKKCNNLSIGSVSCASGPDIELCEDCAKTYKIKYPNDKLVYYNPPPKK